MDKIQANTLTLLLSISFVLITGCNNNSAIDKNVRPADKTSSTSTNQKSSESTPSRPTGLNISAIPNNSFEIKWKDNANNEIGYVIERSLNLFGEYTTVGQVSRDTTTFKDSDLSASTTYFYRVTAFNSTSKSTYSDVAYNITYDRSPQYYASYKKAI